MLLRTMPRARIYTKDAKALEKLFRAQPKPGRAKPSSPPAAAAAAAASGGAASAAVPAGEEPQVVLAEEHIQQQQEAKKATDDEWVQCEEDCCGKWRMLPPCVKADTPLDRCVCSMSHWLGPNASCLIPGDADEPEEEEMDDDAGTEYTDGSGSGSGSCKRWCVFDTKNDGL